MSKTQMVRVFVMMFRMLYGIMMMNAKCKRDESEAYSLITEAQTLMNEIAND